MNSTHRPVSSKRPKAPKPSRKSNACARAGATDPGDPEKFWTWCLEQHRDTLLELLAFCAACSVNAFCRKPTGRTAIVSYMPICWRESVTLDMKAWFTPDAGNYFSRISKAGIIEALQEAKGDRPPPHGTA